MARYCSHTVILPDGSSLDDFIVEVNGCVALYYPFAGEVHSTLYIDTPILLSYNPNLEGKSVSLSQFEWALRDADNQSVLYAYRLVPCAACAPGRFTLARL